MTTLNRPHSVGTAESGCHHRPHMGTCDRYTICSQAGAAEAGARVPIKVPSVWTHNIKPYKTHACARSTNHNNNTTTATATDR